MTNQIKASEVKMLDVLVFCGREHTVRKIATDGDQIFFYFVGYAHPKIAFTNTDVAKKI